MEINKSNRKNDFFSILPYVNFILSLLIVMHHSFTLNVDYNIEEKDIAWAVERYLYNLSECAVPVFFFFSAMLFYRNYDGSGKAYIIKLKKRIVSLLIPYVIFNTLGYLKHILVSGKSFTVISLIKSILTSDTMPLWFVRELMIFIVLAPVIYYLKNKKIIFGICTVIILPLITLGIAKYRTFLYWLPIYCLGAMFKIDWMMNIKSIKNIPRFVSGLFASKIIKYSILLGYLFWVWMLPNTTGIQGYVGNFNFYLFRVFSVPIVIAIFVHFNSSVNSVKRAPEIFNYSFWVYCVHFPMISIYRLVFEKVFLVKNSVMELIEYFSTIVVVYLGAICIAMIIKKIIPHLWKILNGGRS
ncbi:acyltransferase [Clostridium paraputrificum]|uniref:acyltransferase family protein n=1 Tax=Clostridium TaxID=1485 RepID=UPI00232CF61E|nr:MULTISPECIES: acyltransferase [Clostridium]MDB2103245.1 acyltransferase [Clostridium paraputrificum]MDU6521022.1 acyltransferase [Clostridium sp.]